MPIKHLSSQYRIPRVGRIRLGHKETKNGRTYPVADPFFVIPQELKEYYGEQPTTLHIRFISDDLEVTFPHYLRRYTTSGLRCLGDGEWVVYRVNDAGIVDVTNYHAVTPERKVIMDGNKARRVACPGDQCPHYLAGECKATGFLRFVVEERLRQGYYDLVCHQRAVVGIKTQLLLCLQMFGRLVDIPFLLHRGEPEKIPVRTPQGMRDMPVRTQWIEIEPEWFQVNFPKAQAVLQESLERRRALPSAEDLWGPSPEEVHEFVALAEEEGAEEMAETEEHADEAQPTVEPEAKEHWYDTLQRNDFLRGLAKRGLDMKMTCKLLGIEDIHQYGGRLDEIWFEIDKMLQEK